MKITGKVIEAKTKLGIPAPVFKSDSSGTNLGVGVAADIDGNFTLDNINKGDYITASFVGLKPQTKLVGDNPSINFELTESASTYLNTFEVIADKPKPKPIEAQTPKGNWFKRNQKLVVISAVSIIGLTMLILILKSTKK